MTGDSAGKDAFTKWCKNEPSKVKEGGVMLFAYYNCWQQETLRNRHRGYFCQKPADGAVVGKYVASSQGQLLFAFSTSLFLNKTFSDIALSIVDSMVCAFTSLNQCSMDRNPYQYFLYPFRVGFLFPRITLLFFLHSPQIMQARLYCHVNFMPQGFHGGKILVRGRGGMRQNCQLPSGLLFDIRGIWCDSGQHSVL